MSAMFSCKCDDSVARGAGSRQPDPDKRPRWFIPGLPMEIQASGRACDTESRPTALSFPGEASAAGPDDATPAFLTPPIGRATLRTSGHGAPGSAKPAGIGLGQPGPYVLALL